MYFDFCVTAPKNAGQRMGLDTIFHILGDETYQTPHKGITHGKTYFICTTQGTGIITYNGCTTEINQNECMFMQPSEGFSYRCKNECWHFWWFEITQLPLSFAPNQLLAAETNDFKIELFTQSLLWAKRERWDIAESLFESACGMLHHSTICQNEDWNVMLFRVAQQYIKENISTVTVAKLCEVFNIQERTLRNLFYHAQGHGAKQTIDALRLASGKQLLENTMLPILQIAQQLGYSSQFHFSRAFKQCYQISPQQYRSRRL